MSINSREIVFNEQEMSRVRDFISHYPEGRHKSALLPILHMAQEKFGWCSVEVMDYVASLLNIQPVEVYEVTTFYTMFNVRPTGKYVLEVCRTGPCCLLGAERIIEYMEKKLGIKEGETTPDGLFTIKPVECLAACGYAPVLQMGDYYYENLTEEKIDALFVEWTEKAHEIEHYPGSHI